MSTPTDNKIPTRATAMSDLPVYSTLAIAAGASVTVDTAAPPVPNSQLMGVKATTATTDIPIGVISSGEGGNESGGPSSGIAALGNGAMRCLGSGATMWLVADATVAYGDPVMPTTTAGRVIKQTPGKATLGICIGPAASQAQGAKILVLLGGITPNA